jgi:hypothetical protein
VILGLAQAFPPDAVERELPDVAAARALVGRERPDVVDLLGRRRERLLARFGLALADELGRCEDALLLGVARFGRRHGSWGLDYHHYHNENHALEILDGRLGRLMDDAGLDALPGPDWLVLSLFSCCHDLRQREDVDFSHPVGNNEAASIAEAHRILDAAGYVRERDRPQYLALELMIAGSTFDARPAPPTRANPAELAASGGALAPRLPQILDAELPGWRDDVDTVRALRLALIASDLDTANVAEPFVWLAESAARLCQEREMLAGRALEDRASGQPCLAFLSHGQERYFFDLHRFCSELGEGVFGQAKSANAGRVRAVSASLRQRYGDDRAAHACGAAVLDTFARLSLAD